ncbi:nitroreductase [Lacrimispora sp. AGF001]|jgi:nitroreductase|uniref:nitroreductase n=1 Tax=Lacrimispora sp. AGF001 TaxID=3401631 RepID=UPI003B42E094|nr:hypothetical protein [Paenibacillaceae bacterium]
MNVKEGIFTRRSTRAFLADRQIAEETIRELIEIAGHSPSWSSSQPWEVYVVTGEKMKNLKEAWKAETLKGIPEHFDRSDIPGPGFDDWKEAPLCVENMAIWKENRLNVMGVTKEEYGQILSGLFLTHFDAPTCVYLCLNKSLSEYSYYDLGAFGQTLMLAATERGIDTMAAYSPVMFGDLLHEELGIPENTNIVLGIYMGYRDPDHFVNKPDAIQMDLDKYLKIITK